MMPSAPVARRRGRRRLSALRALASGAVLLGTGACAHAFDATKISNPVELYRASSQRLQRRKWDDALAGFDRLATQLPARDTLLPRVYFYQGQAHARKGDHLLAAQAYARIQDAFPDDSLAPEALYEEGREYQKLWDNPALDPQYGQTALATYRQLLQLYPESPRVQDAGRQIARINQMFAAKDLEAGMYYLRKKAYDPALIYFKDVVRLYPGTPGARGAYLRMVQAYRAINYKEEMAEACAEMRKTYAGDAEVARSCGNVPPVASPAPTTVGSAPAAASGAAAGTVPANATAAPSPTATPVPTRTPVPTSNSAAPPTPPSGAAAPR